MPIYLVSICPGKAFPSLNCLNEIFLRAFRSQFLISLEKNLTMLLKNESSLKHCKAMILKQWLIVVLNDFHKGFSKSFKFSSKTEYFMNYLI